MSDLTPITLPELNAVYADKMREGKVVILYHANCVDGFYAHMVLRKNLGDNYGVVDKDTYPSCTIPHSSGHALIPYKSEYGNQFIPVAYEETKVIPDAILNRVRGKYVIVVDFSFEIPALKELSRKATSVLIIDHHKTLQERVLEHMKSNDLDVIRMRNLSGLRRDDFDLLEINTDEDYMPTSDFENVLVVYDERYCGSVLATTLFDLTFLHTAAVHGRFIDYHTDGWLCEERINLALEGEGYIPLRFIQDYDRYTLEFDNTKAVHAALHAAMYYQHEYWWYDLINRVYAPDLDEIGNAILAKEHKQLQAYIDTARIGLLGDQQVVFVNATSDYTNDIGEALSNLHGLPVAIWHTRKDYTKVSLRSSKTNGDFDVGTLAQLYGGGGHRNAASFSIPIGAEFDCRFM